MKFLLLISTFYILLLPCIPCTDKNECGERLQTAVVNSPADHRDHQHENEACNPFCACACCGHILIPNFRLNKIGVTKLLAKQKQQYFYNNISLSSDFFGNIWQPPKFS